MLFRLQRAELRHNTCMTRNRYSVTAAKAHLSAILDHVERTQQEVVLTRRGKPIARIVPDGDEQPRQLGFARGEVKLLRGWEDPITFEEFLRE
jgi:prevent-host-death family protein